MHGKQDATLFRFTPAVDWLHILYKLMFAKPRHKDKRMNHISGARQKRSEVCTLKNNAYADKRLLLRNPWHAFLS